MDKYRAVLAPQLRAEVASARPPPQLGAPAPPGRLAEVAAGSDGWFDALLGDGHASSQRSKDKQRFIPQKGRHTCEAGANAAPSGPASASVLGGGRRRAAAEADISGDVFDNFFGDWHTSPTKAVHENAELSFSEGPCALQSRRDVSFGDRTPSSLEAGLVPSGQAIVSALGGGCRRSAAQVDVSDDVFADFFGDWHAPPSKAVHANAELSFSEGPHTWPSREDLPPVGRAPVGATSCRARQDIERRWGKLGSVDDIFSELNNIDAGANRGGA